MATVALTAALSVALAAVHAFGGRIRGSHGLPRRWVLSAGSGVAVAYVALHLLPEVAAIEHHLGGGEILGWLALLVGVVAFHGLELFARRHGGRDSAGAGWTHLAAYGLYNAAVGYVLVEQAGRSDSTAILFGLAMAVHFLVNDHGLREHHEDLYRHAGRWLVAAGVVGGTVLSWTVHVGEAAVGLLLAFLAGGVLINVFKEELPEDRSARWAPMAVGAGGYGSLLVLLA